MRGMFLVEMKGTVKIINIIIIMFKMNILGVCIRIFIKKDNAVYYVGSCMEAPLYTRALSC